MAFREFGAGEHSSPLQGMTMALREVGRAAGCRPYKDVWNSGRNKIKKKEEVDRYEKISAGDR